MKILVTAGPTREWLDPVRFISNPATGRLGYLIAAEAARRGMDACLVSGPVTLPPPVGVRVFPVETAREMDEAVRRFFPGVGALFMTAAVGDWRPRYRRGKVKKQFPRSPVSLTLYPNPDILAACGRRKKPGQLLIGFALETADLLAAAQKKIRAKNLDHILVNDPGFFGDATRPHQSFLVSRDGTVRDYSRFSKDEIAGRLLDLCAPDPTRISEHHT